MNVNVLLDCVFADMKFILVEVALVTNILHGLRCGISPAERAARLLNDVGMETGEVG